AVLKGSLRPNPAQRAPSLPAGPRNAVAPAMPSIPLSPAVPMQRPSAGTHRAVAVGPGEAGVAAIRARAETVEDEDPFVTLGLRDGAPVEEARAAFIRLAKMWHPDRLTAELAPVRDEVGKIFSQMTTAHHTLTDA